MRFSEYCTRRSLLFACCAILFFPFLLHCVVQSRGRHHYVAKILPYAGLDPAFQLELNPKKRFVILLTSFRSGSTFLGKMFDENPDIFYMFEPFHDAQLAKFRYREQIVGAQDHHTAVDLQMLYLQQLMHDCFTIRGTRFFREKHKFCGKESENLARFNTTRCVMYKFPDLTYQSYREICHHRDTAILKVIRLSNIRDILKIRNIESADVSIIHSIRDPRAMMASRSEFGRATPFYWRSHHQLRYESDYKRKKLTLFSWEMYNYCTETMRSVSFAKAHPWLKNRYLLLTHRQMSHNPVQTAEKVYDFLNLTLSNSLRQFLKDTTSGKATELKAVLEWVDTSRNSSEVLNKWKGMKEVGISELYSIESQCKTLLKLAGEDFATASDHGISSSLLKRVYDGLLQ